MTSRHTNYVPFPEVAAAAFGSRRRNTQVYNESNKNSPQFNPDAVAAFSSSNRTHSHQSFDSNAKVAFSSRKHTDSFSQEASQAFGSRKERQYDSTAEQAFGNRKVRRGPPPESALAVARRRAFEEEQIARVRAEEDAKRKKEEEIRDSSNLMVWPELASNTGKITVSAKPKLNFVDVAKKRKEADEAEEKRKKDEEAKKLAEARLIEAEKRHFKYIRFRRTYDSEVYENENDIVNENDEHDERDSYSEVDDTELQDEDSVEEELDNGEFNAHLFRGY